MIGGVFDNRIEPDEAARDSGHAYHVVVRFDHGAMRSLDLRPLNGLRAASGWTMRPGQRKKLNPFVEPDFVANRVEKMKAGIRVKVEHSFRAQAPDRGSPGALPRSGGNTAQLITRFAHRTCGWRDGS